MVQQHASGGSNVGHVKKDRAKLQIIVVALIALLGLGIGFVATRAISGQVSHPAAAVGSGLQSDPSLLSDTVHAEARTASGEAPPERLNLIVRVVTWDGAPIQGALVASVASGEIFGTTSQDGETRCSPTPGDSVRVAKEGFRTSRFEFLTPSADVKEVVLANADCIAGRVVNSQGQSPNIPIRVFAWESSKRSNGAELVLQALQGKGDLMTTCQADGRFQICGVRQGIEYELAAGGGGYVQSRYSTVVSAEESNVTIKVIPGFGLTVLPVDKTGTGIDRSQFQPGLVKYELTPTTQGLRVYSLECASTILAAEDCDLLRSSKSGLAFLFAGDTESSAIECYLSLSIAGYAPKKEVVSAARIIGETPTFKVSLESLVGGWADVTVNFMKGSPGAGEVMSSCPAGRLVVSRIDGGDPIMVAVDESPQPKCVLHNIPFGTYTCEFRGHGGVISNQEQVHARVVVGRDGGRVDLFLGSVGAVMFTIRRKDGSYYDGACVLKVAESEPKTITEEDARQNPRLRVGAILVSGVFTKQFQASPYRMEGLFTGKYSVRLHSPLESPGRGNYTTFEIKSDQESLVEFTEQ